MKYMKYDIFNISNIFDQICFIISDRKELRNIISTSRMIFKGIHNYFQNALSF